MVEFHTMADTEGFAECEVCEFNAVAIDGQNEEANTMTFFMEGFYVCEECQAAYKTFVARDGGEGMRLWVDFFATHLR